MISVTEYTKLKAAAEKAQQEADRASGAFDQALKQLEKEFGIKGIEEAKELLAKLQQEEKAAESKFLAKLEKFNNEFGHLFTETAAK